MENVNGEHDGEWNRPENGLPENPPGEQLAAQERAFWEARRRSAELDGGEEGRDARGARERRRLGRAARRLHLNVRGGRLARGEDPGPVPRDLRLPPLPEREGAGWEEPED